MQGGHVKPKFCPLCKGDLDVVKVEVHHKQAVWTVLKSVCKLCKVSVVLHRHVGNGRK